MTLQSADLKKIEKIVRRISVEQFRIAEEYNEYSNQINVEKALSQSILRSFVRIMPFTIILVGFMLYYMNQNLYFIISTCSVFILLFIGYYFYLLQAQKHGLRKVKALEKSREKLLASFYQSEK